MDLNVRRSGILLHPTSLPGAQGVGDLGDSAYHFVDWLQAAGQTVWQWLPSTPIGPGDSPYQSVSAFAGSPLMVALGPLVRAGWLVEPALPEGGFSPERVHFGPVQAWRSAQLRAAAAGFAARATAPQRAAFAAWCAREASWLDDYALFMALQTAHQGRPWWQWAAPLRQCHAAALANARTAQAEEIFYWQFVQWCFDEQLAALKAYANERGVYLMGDLPIFIAHHSVDCWARPDLYVLDGEGQPTGVAGVPPDALSLDGQRWGNPLYRWERMAADGYAWWLARIRRALAQADCIRIDHFRGFAGYYEIPASSPTAHQGRWLPGPGQALFDAIEHALGKLPIVAEDLGLVTPDVLALLRSTGFPGMRIAQFGFGGDASHEFLPHNWPPHCVAYTGTHDNDTLRGWWDAAPERERAFAAAYFDCDAQSLHARAERALCMSAAQLVVFPLQDVLGLDATHRMNIPGTLGPHNWSWRFVWEWVGPEPARRLAALAAASGRVPLALLKLPP